MPFKDRFAAVDFRCDKLMSEPLRIETGSYYTPYSVALWMVEKTLEDWLSIDNWDHLPNVQLKDAVDQILVTTVLEPSSGSGTFICAYLTCCEKLFTLYKDQEYFLSILPKLLQNIYACDLQQEPLRVYQSLIAEAYAINPSEVPVYQVDILDDEAIASHSQLHMQMTVGFDLVFGNPPYLGEKSNRKLFGDIRRKPFGQRYYEGKMDLFYYFAYRGILSLKPQGIMTLITTNYFPTADGAKHFRSFLKNEGVFKWIVNLGSCQLFQDALGQNNMIWSYQRSSDLESLQSEVQIWEAQSPKCTLKALNSVYSNEILDNWNHSTLLASQLYDAHGQLQMYCSNDVLRVLKEIEAASQGSLGDYYDVNQGIVSGADKDFKEKQGIFVLTENEVGHLKNASRFIKPLYKNKDVFSYKFEKSSRDYILYLTGNESFEAFEWETIEKHLNPYKSRLQKRREVEKGVRPWYALQWPRSSKVFENEKIIAPQRSLSNTFAYSNIQTYGSADLYYIGYKCPTPPWQLKPLTLYLNSKIVYYWLYYQGKRKGNLLELYATPLKKIPLPKRFSQSDFNSFETILNQILANDSIDTILELSHIDHRLYQHFNLSEHAIKAIETLYERNVINKIRE